MLIALFDFDKQSLDRNEIISLKANNRWITKYQLFFIATSRVAKSTKIRTRITGSYFLDMRMESELDTANR